MIFISHKMHSVDVYDAFLVLVVISKSNEITKNPWMYLEYILITWQRKFSDCAQYPTLTSNLFFVLAILKKMHTTQNM